MSGTFALGSFSRPGGAPFAAMVIETLALPLAVLDRVHGAAGGARLQAGTLPGILEDWQRNFDILQALALLVGREGAASPAFEATPLSALRVLPPIPRPGKILHSAANYRGHVKEMAAYNVAGGNTDPAARFTGDKTHARPYLFLKASSALTGAYDDIVLPAGEHQIDWEAELAVVIGRRAKRVSAGEAHRHIAGYMTTNDVTCRDLLWREDRQNFRTDWLASKSHDGFAPMGPLFVPREFIADPDHLRITLKVNGVTKQDGNTSEMIFPADEQIEYASRIMSLEPGDIFVTGTVGGVGQATNEFLKAGDVMETEVHGVGLMRNRVVSAG